MRSILKIPPSDAYVDVGYLNIQRHAFLHTAGIHRSEIANPMKLFGRYSVYFITVL